MRPTPRGSDSGTPGNCNSSRIQGIDMDTITNPILPGFNPDPSILRVGNEYYIATSTFEWFPGVQIHHSRDLVHWELIARPLNRISQLDMRGNPDSGGVWAPCLSYAHGTFHLIYTDMKTVSGSWLDSPNYLVTAENISGDWSEPIHLNSSGFDPSLFHDDDGRKWLVNMLKDHRQSGAGSFAGIVLQEYSPGERKLVGPVRTIFNGTELAVTEGPHLYKKDGYYYLLTAEGGTGYEHAVTLARSRSIEGPYEVHPENPVLTSLHTPDNPLQKAGHADLVETQNGEWYMVHLCGRPLSPRGRCMLGRETAIQKVEWGEDGWLRLAGKAGNEPSITVPAPGLPEQPIPAATSIRDDFDLPTLALPYQTLRGPLDESRMSLAERPGHLRLRGGHSLSSPHHQSLVARRRDSFVGSAETCVEFEPETFQQMAGLVCYYNTANFYYLHITHDETVGKCLSIIVCDNGAFSFPLQAPMPIPPATQCRLKAEFDHADLRFSCSSDGQNWTRIGDVFDAGTLSDEAVAGWAFTGTFVGICCQDLSGAGKPADFDFFEWTPVST